ncbi:hypothetical protein CASFOL_025362 [Castilleja foliolosa]|uniref:Jacalin-type lectin domain-containing protein n=1 Tax=Castilleja foliolosa TaxID=1961234 RepID=A0ABD3CQW2_9LAMI
MGSLREGVISLGPWGGSAGNNWSFRGNRAITSITIYYFQGIRSISFTDATGSISGNFGGDTSQEQGSWIKVDINWPSEYLKYITGSVGTHFQTGTTVIMSLSFGTNLRTYGPYGPTSQGTPFSIPVRDDVVVGFYGRSSQLLDAIGVFVQPINSHQSITFGPWGSEDGDPFNFRVGTWIKEITVQYGRDHVISVAFKDANGQQYGKFGGNYNLNDLDGERTVVINEPFEHLTSISGTVGLYMNRTVIRSISFITNLTTHGPFGSGGFSAFSIPMRGSIVNGFHGRASDYLYAIGIDVKVRERPEETISIGPWGGPGGNAWSYTTNGGINQIIMHVGQNIKSISFRDTTGHGSATFGGNNPNDTAEMETVNIGWPSEHLVSISGTYGNFGTLLTDGSVTIQSIAFTTTLATYGPFGSPSGTSFSIPINNNTVVGFHGRAGNYVDAIGIFVKPETII